VTTSIPGFDLYATLSVTPDAPVEVIAAAHRALIRMVHPDLHADAAAAETATRLNVARDWLTDPARRTLYDRSRRPEDPANVDARSAAVPRPPLDRELAARVAALDGFVRECARLSAADLTGIARGCRQAMARDRGLAATAERLVRAARLAGREGMALRAAEDARWRLEVWHGNLDASLLTLLHWTAYAHAAADVAPGDAELVLAHWQGSARRRARDARRTARSPGRLEGIVHRLRAGLGRA
jgi:curved DNA-binding protein CbpA